MFGSVFDDVFDDLFSLVDLHGKYGLISAFVGEFFYGSQEGPRDFIDPVFQHLRKSQEHGKLEISGFLDLFNEIHDIHGLGAILIGEYDNIAFIIY